MRQPLDICVHEAGHAIVAVHFHGPCIKGITVRPDGSGCVEVSAAALRATPLEKAAFALAGGVAERLLTPAAVDPNPSEPDLDLVERAFAAWSGGTTIELERRAFFAAAARKARAILLHRLGELVELAETLAVGADIPEAYLAPTARKSPEQPPRLVVGPLAPAAARPEVKSPRDALSDSFAARLEANGRRTYALSSGVAAREAWGAA